MSDVTRFDSRGSNAGVTFATEVSRYDRVFGGLVASILLGLFLFLTLLSIWYFQSPALPTFDPPDRVDSRRIAGSSRR